MENYFGASPKIVIKNSFNITDFPILQEEKKGNRMEKEKGKKRRRKHTHTHKKSSQFFIISQRAVSQDNLLSSHHK